MRTPTSPRRRGSALIAFFLAASGVLAAPAPLLAQTPDEVKAARATAGQGLAAYEANKFDEAAKLFSQAKVHYPSAQVLRMLGYSELALEHWVKAVEALEASLESKLGPLSKPDQKDVNEQMAKALAHVGTAMVKSGVAGAELTIDDGEPMKLPLAKPVRLHEGVHKLVVKAPDHLDASNDLKVEPGKSAEVMLDPPEKPKPKPPPPPPPPPPPKPERKEWVPNQKMVGMAAIGTGAAVGVAGLITGLIGVHNYGLASDAAAAHTKSFGDKCARGDLQLCTLDVQLTNNEAQKATTVKSAGLGLGIAGGVLAATGVVFVIAAPKKSSEPKPADDAAPPPQAALRPSVSCGVSGLGGLLCSGKF